MEHEETLEKSDGTCFGLVQIVTELNLDLFLLVIFLGGFEGPMRFINHPFFFTPFFVGNTTLELFPSTLASRKSKFLVASQPILPPPDVAGDSFGLINHWFRPIQRTCDLSIFAPQKQVDDKLPQGFNGVNQAFFWVIGSI